MPEKTWDAAIIGGGAAGMMAALSLLEYAKQPLRVVLLERQSRVGKKLMATGNGRCNLTNMHPTAYHTSGDPAFVEEALGAFPPEEVLAFFERCGVYPREEEDGRVYPLSDQASSVVDALRFSCAERGIETLCDFDVTSVQAARGIFSVRAADGRSISSKRVILAAGGAAAPKLGGTASGYRLAESLGHRTTPRFAALSPLKTESEIIRPLKGSKYAGGLTLLANGKPLRHEEGEILFTEYGLSGIAAMQLSRLVTQHAGEKLEALLTILPLAYPETLELLKSRLRNFPNRPLEEFLTGLVNKRLGQVLIRQATGLALNLPASQLSAPMLSQLARLLTGWRLRVSGAQGFDQAQVTAGGVRTQEINPATMESRIVRGLYFAGELIDVDGDCGGYNLQWAWASGMLAGAACAQSFRNSRSTYDSHQ